MKKRSLFIGFAMVLSLPALAFAAQVQVSLGNNSISPSTININTGDTVVWNNTSSVPQSVMANNSSFQSGAIAPGGQFAATFNTGGTYNYYDNAQGSAILGEINVSGSPVTTSVTTSAQTTYTNPNINYNVGASSNTNASAESLTSQVQALIAEINAVEGKSGTAGTGTGVSYSGATAIGANAPAYTVGSCPQIGRVLSIGDSGSDVSSLQQFLAVNPSIYPQGLVTGYYGALTEAAVQNWQTKYNVVSSGTPGTTGFGVLGPRTAAAIRLACANGTGSSGQGSGVVSGFLQVSPISGSAPLSVTANATVNTAGDCGGATYTLDFGDGTQDQKIPVAAGNCAQGNQVFQHTYQYGGTYLVALSAGGHQSTATVTVSGPSAPTVAGLSTPTQATGSMSALVSSGNAPLSTTFYVSCASGLAYDVVFGDGSDLGGTGVSQSTCNGGLQAIAHTYSSPGTYNAQLVVFTQNSTGVISPQTVATQTITAAGTTSTNGGSGGSVSSGGSISSPPTLVPDYGGNALAVQLSFAALACGQPYSINWGDASPASSVSVTCAAGASTSQTASYSPTYTYAAAGNYTITLTRQVNGGSPESDTIGVAITN